MVHELYGRESIQIIRPYLSIAEAYLQRRKLERSRYYTGLINFLQKHKVTTGLPKDYQLELRRLEANQLVREGKFQQAKLILSTQV